MQCCQNWTATKMAMATAIILGVLLQMALVTVGFRLPITDKIEYLPKQPGGASFQQFGGYVTVDEKQGRALFYYFVEAQSHPASKPLLLWFNGDTIPGCSSVGSGAFIEHGPFKVNGQTLVKNDYSWNTEANVLYVDSPAGVGFSYSTNKSFYLNINDAIAARDNLVFLQRWFEKFPQYQKRDLYIAGEAYAGHFVPQLAQLIVNSKLKIKLKGIALGNPLLDIVTDANALDEYWWSHGVISDFGYELLTSICNASRLVREGITKTLSSDCISVATQLSKELSASVNYFNVIGDNCPFTNSSQTQTFSDSLQSTLDALSFGLLQPETCKNQARQEDKDVCSQEYTTKYLNREDVQKALHAKIIGFTAWSFCKSMKDWKYDVRDRLVPTLEILGALLKSKIQVLVFSGDQDSVLPFTGTRTLVDSLAKSLNLQPTVRYRVWLVDKQVGGWTQVYGKLLSFASIRGASQKTAQTQPKRSLVLFKAFLAGKPLPEA